MTYLYQPVIDLSDPQVMRERAYAASVAAAGHYFWLPCPLCGVHFGGHEWMARASGSSIPGDRPGITQGICPFCMMAGRGIA